MTNSKIAQNATWLMVLQISSYIAPFLLLPYLTRTLKAESFGELAVGWAVAAYLAIFADFGFYLWGVKESAVCRDDKDRLSALWSTIQSVKLVLLGLSLPVMLTAAYIAHSSPYLYLFLWLALAGQTLVPGWLYQGMERSFWFLVFNISAQVAAAVATVAVVSSPSDLIYVPLCSALSWVALTMAANVHAVKSFGIAPRIPKVASLKAAFAGSYPLFSANIWVAFYLNLPALAVGFLSTKTEASLFVGAQKIILAAQALFTPISLAIFPRISALASGDRHNAFAFFKKAALYTLPVMAIGSLAAFVLSDFIIGLILGVGFEKSAQLLRIMAFGPLLVAANILLANHLIVAFGHSKKLPKIYAFTAIAALVFVPALVLLFGSYGAAASYMLIELFVFAALLRIASKISFS